MSGKTNHKARRYGLFAVLMLAVATIACYCGTTISEYERGIEIDGGRVRQVMVAGGPHYNFELNTSVEVINVSALNVAWEESPLITQDEQPIGLGLNITFSRPRTDEALKQMWSNYNAETIDDEKLKELVLARVSGPAKTSTAQFTLMQMLGTESTSEQRMREIATTLGYPQETFLGSQGRELLTIVVKQLLERQLQDVGVIINAVTVTNLEPSEEYTDLLERKSNSLVEKEVVINERATNEERLKSETVQTQIEIEIANRQQQVNQINAQAYDKSPALLQIEMARIYAEALDRGDVVLYVPEGSSIVSVLGGQSGVLPIRDVNILEPTAVPQP